MGGRRPRPGEIPLEQSSVVGANIRVLRQRKGWSQGMLGELMGWPTTATVCAAEGHRGGRLAVSTSFGPTYYFDSAPPGLSLLWRGVIVLL